MGRSKSMSKMQGQVANGALAVLFALVVAVAAPAAGATNPNKGGSKPSKVTTTTTTTVAPTTTTVQPTTTTTAARATTAAPMFAYYYLWWSERHWADRLGPAYPLSSTPQPLPATLGADGCGATPSYDGAALFDVDQVPRGQDTPGVIEQDVRDAVAAGLSGFIANWSGTGSATQAIADSSYTRRLAELIRAINEVRSEGKAFSLWISYKGSATIRTLAQINGDLEFFARTWGSDPSLDRSFGKPVVILTGSRKYDTATIRSVSDANRARFHLVGDETSATWNADRAAVLDGDHYYWSSQNPYTNPSSFDQLASLASTVRSSGANPDGRTKTWFAPVSPGYDSTLIGGSTCVPRNGTETLRRLYEGNSRSQPDAWVLISWNEIAEGTHIQPLTRWGTAYTEAVRAIVG